MEVKLFKLTTLFVESQGLHLEGNGGFDQKNTLGGAAFMSPQENASGEIWKMIPLENGYFQLTNLFTEAKGLVLEGNGGINPRSTLGGAAFMSARTDTSGTMWKIIPLNSGYFQLTNLFLEAKGLVLEGNSGINSDYPLDGAAYMSSKTDASGTMWKMIPFEQ